ncbi:MAG: hypothetical protein RR821_13690 [Clostridia bacterium]
MAMAITTVDLGNVRGSAGAEGKSAYEVAVAGGFSGSQAAWVASLKGATGAQGVKGDTGAAGGIGATGAKGADGLTTSVNGVAQVSGNVALTGASIPLSDTDARRLDGVIGGKLGKDDVVNDLVTTVAGKALDATQGKVLGDWHAETMTMLNGRTLAPMLLLSGNWSSGSVTVEGADRYHVFLLSMAGARPAIAIKNPLSNVKNIFVFTAFMDAADLTLTSHYISYDGNVWSMLSNRGGKTLRMNAAGVVKAEDAPSIVRIFGLL